MSSENAQPMGANSGADWLIGGGEMGEQIRSMDWSTTPLGSIESWPQSLRTTVSLCLASNFPISIAWGPHHVQIYNDGYWPICGGKHPRSMGQDFRECWASAMPVIGEAFARALAGETSYLENQRMFLDRNGYLEETFFTFSFSPIRDESGGVGGLFHPVTETTSKMLSERRTRALRDLADRTGKAQSVEEAFALTSETLADYELDLPFALIYRLEGPEQQARLVQAIGLTVGTAASPIAIQMQRQDESSWPLKEVGASGAAVRVDDLEQRFGRLVCGPYPESPKTAILLPITPPGSDYPSGVLVVGVSARLRLNEMYLSFLDLLASAVTTAVANARAYEVERQRAEALAELDRAKTTFFSNVSHEFRTPLTLMLGPVEESLSDADQPLTPKHRERLEIAHRNSMRLQKLVNTLLDFSRIEAGRVQAKYEPTDLASLTTELASNFRSACEKANLQLRLECPPLDELVFVDRDMWEKIVLNLLSNAFKYTLEGEIRVRQRAVDGRVELAVSDTGVGISSEELPRLFERFHRIEGSKGRTLEGSGIGLALVRELVRLHNGEIRVESAPGKGSTFIVTLSLGRDHLPPERIEAARNLASTALGAAPFVEEALRWLPDPTAAPAIADLSLANPASVTGPLAPASAERRPRILLADDNADMRSYVCRLLSPEYDVTNVDNGHAALQVAQTQALDLILSDIMMPGMDGFALVRELRADPRTRELPIIFLSARAGEEARIEGITMGADDYLTKPFSAKELLARVATHLALAKVRKEAAENLRESEARFRNMADNAPVMIWVTDADGRCTYLNKQWYDFTGTKEEQGLDLGWLDSIHPEDQQSTKAIFVEANRKREEFRLEYRLRRHDGEHCWAIDSAVPRFGADGEFLGHIGSVIDIAEIKRIENQLREADRRKDEFLATLAHELRNPLAPIRTGLEVMKMVQGDPDTIEEIRSTMERQAQQLIRLIDDLLDVSRITRGKLELRKCRVELAEVVRSGVEAAQPVIDEAGHRLTVSLPEATILMEADPHRLAQVVSNLLNNAAKYTSRAGQIWLKAEQEGGQIVLKVKDTGMGIPADMLDRIFEMFAQVDQAGERSYAGLGIGLTLVKSLVEMHGGTIAVRSEGPNHGSEFCVRLPMLEEPPIIEPGSVHLELESHGNDKRRVLVVDDNQAAADMLGMVLKMLGHEVCTAGDGQEAIEVAAEFLPEVVVMDLGMPKMNGYEAARHIRRQAWGEGMLLIALTGWGQEENRRRSEEAGFDDHLVKPIEPADLNQLLARGRESV